MLPAALRRWLRRPKVRPGGSAGTAVPAPGTGGAPGRSPSGRSRGSGDPGLKGVGGGPSWWSGRRKRGGLRRTFPGVYGHARIGAKAAVMRLSLFILLCPQGN